MNFCIVSGCDAKYFPYLVDMIDSISSLRVDLAVSDFGVTAEQRRSLVERGVRVIDFRYPHDFPARRQVEVEFPGYGVMLIRPYLDQILPNAEVIVSLDADAWAQDTGAILELVAEASQFGFAAVPEVHRSYHRYVSGLGDWTQGFQTQARCFGEQIAKKLMLIPPINCGLFAIRPTLRSGNYGAVICNEDFYDSIESTMRAGWWTR
jgi:hypothetical protein